MNRRDFYVIGIILALAGILFLLFQKSSSGNSVQITCDGQVFGQYSLKENQEIEVATKYGRNVVVIEQGSVFVKESDCKDHYCEKQGHLETVGRSLICLPHKLVVEIVGETEKQSEVDSIAY